MVRSWKGELFLSVLGCLYGWAMNQNLPTGGLRFVANPEKLKDSFIDMAKKVRKGYLFEIGKGYLLEVVMSYPNDLHDLHDLHNDVSFMCEKRNINRVRKLVPNLYDKKKYVIHIVAFDQAIKHGLVLDKVHRAIEFDQSAWLALYINFNTQLSIKARNDYEKDFFKLINNSVFGRTMKNIRKHKGINLVTNQEAYLKRVMKPNFMSGMRLSENLMGCEMGNIEFQ